ncbi:MAG: family 1 glycosylhydrolase [Acidimicrobiales bacterium]
MFTGAALTSAELEGVADTADWSRWIAKGRAPKSADGAGFRTTWADDLRQLASLGISEVMLTAEWARLQPSEDRYDDGEVELRRRMLEHARDLGLQPWLCLVDGTLPGWFADDEGGFVDDRTRNLLWPRHLDWIGETFGDLVAGIIPQREPILTALRQYRYNAAPPGWADARRAANAVRAALLADGEAWRMLKGSVPIATFQTARIVRGEHDNVKARPEAQLLDDLLWQSWTIALSDGELPVPGAMTTAVPHLRDAFDRIIVQLRPPVLVDATGGWRPLEPARRLELQAEALARVVDEAGERTVVAAGDLAVAGDDQSGRHDYLEALMAAAENVGAAGWWQTSPIDGWHWDAGFDATPGVISSERTTARAADLLRR